MKRKHNNLARHHQQRSDMTLAVNATILQHHEVGTHFGAGTLLEWLLRSLRKCVSTLTHKIQREKRKEEKRTNPPLSFHSASISSATSGVNNSGLSTQSCSSFPSSKIRSARGSLLTSSSVRWKWRQAATKKAMFTLRTAPPPCTKDDITTIQGSERRQTSAHHMDPT